MSEGNTCMEQERARLARVIEVARAELADVQSSMEKSGRAIDNASRAMREEERRSLDGLWTSDGFEEIAAISQLVELRAVDLSTRELRAERARMLTGMLERPYFARIDLTFDDGDDRESVYIGRGMLKDEATHEIYVHDWRAPVASAFYRFGTGRFSYNAPGGQITGAMTLKRQYEIARGALLYYFDVDVRVEDEFLRAMLARNASPRMKAIVETIQRDQDLAIRDAESDLLMVQGAAGSGKTSVALHRAAYLMYRDLKNPLTAGEILILSPNALFETYIAGVLPELGEASAETASFEDILSKLLGGARVETRAERFETLCGAEAGERARRKARMAFLSSPAFRAILERYARELPARGIAFADVEYAGRTLFAREELRARVMKDSPQLPLGARLSRLEGAIWDAVHLRMDGRMEKLLNLARGNARHATEVEECARAYSMLECEALSRQIRAFTRLDPRALYASLLSDERALRRLGKGLSMPEDLTVLRAPCGDELPLEDASAVGYLTLLLQGARKATIRQVVVDEAQDYVPMQYALLGRLFPRARFTVLGDVNQALDRATGMELYDEVESALARRKVARVTLNKSFRCTKEILEFALRFLPSAAGIESFNRSGEAPKEYVARDGAEFSDQVAREIESCRAAGMRSIALIAKTAREARAWADRLGVPALEFSGAGEMIGAFAIPLSLSKGLEFDAVLVLDADNWGNAGQLLYVACTRALHRLSLFTVERGEGA